MDEVKRWSGQLEHLEDLENQLPAARPAEHDAKRNKMRCAMAEETLHMCDLDDDGELDEFEVSVSVLTARQQARCHLSPRNKLRNYHAAVLRICLPRLSLRRPKSP